MVSTTVLLTVVLSTFALMAGAFYAVVHQIGTRIDDLGRRLDRFEDRVDARFDRLDADGAAVAQRLLRLEGD